MYIANRASEALNADRQYGNSLSETTALVTLCIKLMCSSRSELADVKYALLEYVENKFRE